MVKIQRNGISIGLSLKLKRFLLRARLSALNRETNYLTNKLAAKWEAKVTHTMRAHQLKTIIQIYPLAKFKNNQNSKNPNKKKNKKQTLPNSLVSRWEIKKVAKKGGYLRHHLIRNRFLETNSSPAKISVTRRRIAPLQI